MPSDCSRIDGGACPPSARWGAPLLGTTSSRPYLLAMASPAVVVAHEHGLARAILRRIFVHRSIRVVEDGHDSESLSAMCERHQPDVAVVSDTLADAGGADLL